MKIEKTYELLKIIKQNDNQQLKDFSNRLLKYLYQDVYYQKFDLKIEECKNVAPVGSIAYERSCSPLRGWKKNLSLFIDEEESIITYFMEMVNDGKSDFISLFMNKVNTYFDISENHFYDSDDFDTLGFVFNIYTFLKAYHEYKDDYVLFSKIVKDCSFLIDCNGFLGKNSSRNFLERKALIDNLIKFKWVNEVEKMQDVLKVALSKVVCGYYEEGELLSQIKILEAINVIWEEREKLLKENCCYRLCSFDVIANHVLNYDEIRPYYCKLLLFGDRYTYINENLPKYIDNDALQNDFMRLLKQIDYRFVEYLNANRSDEVDSFLELMDIVFDSDSYHEVNSKLMALNEASECYLKGNMDRALELVQKLDSLEHKKVIDGKPFMYISKSINQVSKSVRILDRTIETYNALYHNEYPNLDVKKLASNIPGFLSSFDDDLNFKVQEVIEDEKRKKEEINHFKKDGVLIAKVIDGQMVYVDESGMFENEKLVSGPNVEVEKSLKKTKTSIFRKRS